MCDGPTKCVKCGFSPPCEDCVIKWKSGNRYGSEYHFDCGQALLFDFYETLVPEEEEEDS